MSVSTKHLWDGSGPIPEHVWEFIYRNSMSYVVDKRIADSKPNWASDLIPEAESVGEFSDSFKEHLRNLDAETALERLTIKRPLPERLRAGDGNKFRCPWPDHLDAIPSAWINTTKNTWCCAPCGNVGGDWIDLAAAARGYTRPGQKLRDTGRFGELMRELEAEFGWNNRSLTYVESDEPTGDRPAVQKSRWNLDA